MNLQWPSERISRTGLADFAVAAVGIVVGVLALRRAGLIYLAPPSAWAPVFFLGLAALGACGWTLFRIVRRREYPWILAFAAIALPLFEPSRAPYGVVDRVVLGMRDLALVGAAAVFLIRAVLQADELERRTHVEALSWSYAIVVVTLVSQALLEDVLPPLRGTWVASGMLAMWFVAWVVASIRYQR
jgi:hypothetical protein